MKEKPIVLAYQYPGTWKNLVKNTLSTNNLFEGGIPC
jgi:hypothetical protein